MGAINDETGKHTAARVTKELCRLAFKVDINASLAISCLNVTVLGWRLRTLVT